LISVFSQSRLHVLSKKSRSTVFLHTFTHSQPFNESFIFNGIDAMTVLLAYLLGPTGHDFNAVLLLLAKRHQHLS